MFRPQTLSTALGEAFRSRRNFTVSSSPASAAACSAVASYASCPEWKMSWAKEGRRATLQSDVSLREDAKAIYEPGLARLISNDRDYRNAVGIELLKLCDVARTSCAEHISLQKEDAWLVRRFNGVNKSEPHAVGIKPGKLTALGCRSIRV